MMVLEGAPTRRMYMGQTPAPAGAASPILSFYQLVENVYNQSSNSINSARAGKVDEAKAFLTQAKVSNDQAFDLLKSMRDNKVITPEETSTLNMDVMNPLGNVLGGASEAIVRGGDAILRNWDKLGQWGAGIWIKLTGYAGKKFDDSVNAYKAIVLYNRSQADAINTIMASNPSPEMQAIVNDLKANLEQSLIQQKNIEAAFQRAGLASDTLNKAAGLGAEPILSIVIPGTVAIISGGITIGAVLAVLGSLISLYIAVIAFNTKAILPGWIKAQQRAEIEEQMRESLAVQEKIAKERADAEKAFAQAQAKASGDQLKRGLEMIKSMNQVTNSLTPQQVADLEKTLKISDGGGSGDASDYLPYVLVGGAGLAIAFAIISMRK
jgi:hypothetical protein